MVALPDAIWKRLQLAFVKYWTSIILITGCYRHATSLNIYVNWEFLLLCQQAVTQFIWTPDAFCLT